MSPHTTTGRHFRVGAILVGLTFAACTDSGSPVPDASSRVTAPAAVLHNDAPGEPNAGAHETKAFISAWLNGEAVELRYTRSYFCEEPPESIAPTGCEIGALPEDFPRGGRIPVIYALAPAFTPGTPLPNASTLHCSPSAPCANHPPMIDVTRLHLPISIANSPAHSHIITSRQAGWHRTVNIRVLSPTIWNQIAADPTLETVRRLQTESPTLISGDNPTNIFFFFEVRSQTPE
jgi:hypothetical protein